MHTYHSISTTSLLSKFSPFLLLFLMVAVATTTTVTRKPKNDNYNNSDFSFKCNSIFVQGYSYHHQKRRATETAIAFTTIQRRIKSLHEHGSSKNSDDDLLPPQLPSTLSSTTKVMSKNKNKNKKRSTTTIQSKTSAYKLKSNSKKKSKRNRKTKTKNLGTETETQTFEQRWNEKYNQLIEYKSIHGHCNVPQNDKDNPSLGRWVRSQRVEYAHFLRPYLYNYDNLNGINDINHFSVSRDWSENKELKEMLSSLPSTYIERIEKLNDMGFVWDVKEDIWFHRVQDLIEFKNMYGHVRVPQRWSDETDGTDFKDRDNCSNVHVQENSTAVAILVAKNEHCQQLENRKRWRRLGLWVRNQRAQYKSLRSGSKKNHSLTEERIRLLESIGFCWDVQESIWNERYDSLKNFKKVYGHVNVPCVYKDDPTLARWVMQIRYAYREMIKQQKDDDRDEIEDGKFLGKTKSSSENYMTKLTPERIDFLNRIGFVWDKNDAYWWEQYKNLVEFRKINGHCSVPSDYHNVQLRNWVMNMRRLCRIYDWKKLHMIQNDLDKGDKVLVHVAGLNEERLAALGKIGFTKTLKPRGSNETKKVEKVQVKLPNNKRNEKKILPFPWDEI